MSIVESPLFSLGARGTLGGSLYFCRHRGHWVVREHGVSGVPVTSRQAIQRGHFSKACAEWWLYTFTEADREAFNRLAGGRPNFKIGFNAYLSEALHYKVAGGSEEIFGYDFDYDVIVGDRIAIRFKMKSEPEARLYWSTGVRNQISFIKPFAQSESLVTFELLEATPRTRYFFHLRTHDGETNRWVRSGTYEVRT